MVTVQDEYLDDFHDLSPKDDRGVLKKITRESTLDFYPCKGDTAFVHYVGTNYGGEEHGKVFDSSRDRNEVFTFTVGTGDVIKAWDIAIASMKIGEICELVASPDYAYMDGRTLKFEIELIDTRGEDVSERKDCSVLKSIVKEGYGFASPAAGMPTNIILKKYEDGSFGEPQEISYFVGDLTPDVSEAIDRAVRKMKSSETCRVKISRPKPAGGMLSSGDVFPGSEDLYEIHLKSFEKVKHLASLITFEEQMEHANKMKERANVFLKKGKYSIAVQMYDIVNGDLMYLGAKTPEETAIQHNVSIAIQLNMALAYLKLNDPSKCMEFCKRVLDNDYKNEKALFRMGQACLVKKDIEEATKYFQLVVRHHPNNTESARQLKNCEQIVQKVAEKEKKMYRSVYEKLKQNGLGDDSLIAPGDQDELEIGEDLAA